MRLVRTLVGITGAFLLAACGADETELTTGEPPLPGGSEPQAAESDALLSITDVADSSLRTAPLPTNRGCWSPATVA